MAPPKQSLERKQTSGKPLFSPETGPEGWISFQIAALSNKLSKSASRRVAAHSKLSLAEWRVVALLGVYGPATVGELAILSSFDKSWISRSASSLEMKGLIRYAGPSADSRKVPFELTKAGSNIYKREAAASTLRNQKLLSIFNDAERARLFGMIEQLKRQSDKLDEQS